VWVDVRFGVRLDAQRVAGTASSGGDALESLEGAVMKFTIKQTFDVDEETFWHRIHLDEGYNRALYQDHLKFRSFKVLDNQKHQDGSVTRRIELAPAVELPGAVKKVIGDVTTYVEDGRFDPAARRWRFTANPAATDKIQTSGEIRVESRGPKQIERIVEMEVVAKIFGVGKMIEGFIEQQTRANFEKGEQFTRQWIKDKGL
jgi:hypothetical protein